MVFFAFLALGTGSSEKLLPFPHRSFVPMIFLFSSLPHWLRYGIQTCFCNCPSGNKLHSWTELWHVFMHTLEGLAPTPLEGSPYSFQDTNGFWPFFFFFEFLLPILLMSHPRNCAKTNVKDLLALFSSRTCMVLGLTFKSLIHFKFIFGEV